MFQKGAALVSDIVAHILLLVQCQPERSVCSQSPLFACTDHDTGTLPPPVQLIIANGHRQLRERAQH